MSLMVYLSLAYVSILWLGFLLLNFIFTLLRNILWLCNGTYSKIWANRKPENYATSGHMMTIIFKHRLDVFIESRISDYVLLHDSFVPPEYVLRDEISLLQITDKEAIFVQRPAGSKPPFLFPFAIMGQFPTAEKVITMPLESFHRLADSMEGDDAKWIFLQNQSRCGGTLFNDIFKFTDRCVAFSEPHAPNAVCKYYYMKEAWDRATAIKMLRSTMKLLCKPYMSLPDGKVLAYITKPTATSTMMTELIAEALPDATQFFIYREPMNIAISLRRLAQALPTLKLYYYLPNVPQMTAPLFRFIGYCEMDFRGWTPKYTQELEFGYRVAALTMKYYLLAKERGLKVHGIRYEVLRDNSERMTSRIFELCGIPESMVANGLRAFGRDSQGETGFSQAILNRLVPNPPKPSPEILDVAREMAKEFKVPGPDEWNPGYILPGTLLPE